eukprot:TRINITY_DN6983_c0_g1_i2.p1 TRINITY_DN6983_c0_g1~~TRINITY_DN6983_c0_g1_i2.p1  ORF type:complete len:592 (-),score=71.46 TRINITY_DN6983_c0_g1_i2:324-2099(-)
MSLQVPMDNGVVQEVDVAPPTVTRLGASGSSSKFSTGSSETGRSWKEWAGREDDAEHYKFGDLSRGMLNAMTSSVREMKYKVADTAMSMRDRHEQRAVEYVRELAKEDEHVKGIAESTIGDVASTSTWSERIWCEICKDAHTDHKRADDTVVSDSGSNGTLQVRLLDMGSQHPICRRDGSKASKPVVLLCLENQRSGGLRKADSTSENEAVASFQISEVLGSDLGVYVFDRGSARFKMGSEDQAFCGGCLVPLTEIIQDSSGDSLGSGLRSSCSGLQFHAQFTLKLLPLDIVRAKCKLEPASLTGAKQPEVDLGMIRLDLRLTLKEVPMKLYFQPLSIRQAAKQTLADYKGHVGDPLSVLKAAGMAVGRVGSALQIERWKVAADELRESTALAFGWSLLVLVAPLWVWPLLSTLMVPLFALKLSNVPYDQDQQPCMYVDPDRDRSYEALMKEVVKMELNIMQLTETFNKAATRLEKIKFSLTFEDRCRSFVCLCVLLAGSLVMSVGLYLLLLVLEFVNWRFLLWLPGTCFLSPKALRHIVCDAAAKVLVLTRKITGDNLDRALAGLWHRIPDGVEALHLALFKRYVLCKNG